MAALIATRTQLTTRTPAPLSASSGPDNLYCGNNLCEPGHLFSEMQLLSPDRPIPAGMIKFTGIQLEPVEVALSGLETVKIPPYLAAKPTPALLSALQRQHPMATNGPLADLGDLVATRQMDNTWRIGVEPRQRDPLTPRQSIGILPGKKMADLMVALNAQIVEKQRLHQFPDLLKVMEPTLYVLHEAGSPNRVLHGIVNEQGVKWPSLPTLASRGSSNVISSFPTDHLTVVLNTKPDVAVAQRTMAIPLYTEAQLHAHDIGKMQLRSTSVDVFLKRMDNAIQMHQRGPEPLRRTLPDELVEEIEFALKSAGLTPAQQLAEIQREAKRYPDIQFRESDIKAMTPDTVSAFRLSSPQLSERCTGLGAVEIAQVLAQHLRQYQTHVAIKQTAAVLGDTMANQSDLQNIAMINTLYAQAMTPPGGETLIRQLLKDVGSHYVQPFFNHDTVVSRPDMAPLRDAMLRLEKSGGVLLRQRDATAALNAALSQIREMDPNKGAKLAGLALFTEMVHSPIDAGGQWLAQRAREIATSQNIPTQAPVKMGLRA